jgi:hypothetical protein
MTWRVEIKFLRIQSFLAAFTGLREMIGANVLLGETVRVRLRERVAVSKGLKSSLEPVLQAIQALDYDVEDDPLEQQEIEEDDKDRPLDLYRHGILARDGGHFTALFANRPDADRFRGEAAELLQEELPGLPFRIEPSEIGETDRSRGEQTQARAGARFDPPWIQVCQESGRGAATQRASWPGGESLLVSPAVAEMHEQGRRFFDKDRHTRDMIGLLRDRLPLHELPPPQDLHQLCETGYLAVVHADGNGIGERYLRREEASGTAPDANTSELGPYLRKEAHGERFYHGMRVRARAALLAALRSAVERVYGDANLHRQPYQLLMVGGDDLLLVCQARFALPFVAEYAEELRRKPLADEKYLGIGAGVVISRPNVPFYHLHAVAEELAGSAKRLFRSQQDPGLSTVDWLVSSGSWVDDVAFIRRRDERIRYRAGEGDSQEEETLLLTAKPYPVLGGTSPSLATLLQATNRLEEGQIARSQLRALVEVLRTGRFAGELAFLELEGGTRETLEKAMTAGKIEGVWKALEDGTTGPLYQTWLQDLVECYEIERLGRGKNGKKLQEG